MCIFLEILLHLAFIRRVTITLLRRIDIASVFCKASNAAIRRILLTVLRISHAQIGITLCLQIAFFQKQVNHNEQKYHADSDQSVQNLHQKALTVTVAAGLAF